MNVGTVKWTGGRQFVGVDGSGHSLVMDSTPQYGGEGSGFRPVELVLQGLAGCSAMDVISILEKKRQDVRGLEVHVKGEQREDAYPHSYTTIELEFVVTGYGVQPEAVARAIELSEEKYCSVKGTLAPDVEIRTSFRVVEARPSGTAALADGA